LNWPRRRRSPGQASFSEARQLFFGHAFDPAGILGANRSNTSMTVTSLPSNRPRRKIDRQMKTDGTLGAQHGHHHARSGLVTAATPDQARHRNGPGS